MAFKLTKTESQTLSEFSAATHRALALKGISLYGITALPDMASDMPYANATRGYKVNDNRTARVWTFDQVKEAAR